MSSFWDWARYWITENGIDIFYDAKVGIDTDLGDTLVANHTVKRDTGQTANMSEWWDESGTTLARVLENGQIESNGYAEDVKTIVVPGGGSTYIATDEQSIFLYDISAGSGVLTLPDPSTLPLGRKYKAKIINTNTSGPLRTLTVNSAAGQVELATKFVMGTLQEAIVLHHDGTDWFIWPLVAGIGNTRTVLSSETARASDGLLLVSTAAGDVSLQLPLFADVRENWEITIKKTTSDMNEVNINTAGVDKIDDITTYDLLAHNETVTIIKAATQWWIK